MVKSVKHDKNENLPTSRSSRCMDKFRSLRNITYLVRCEHKACLWQQRSNKRNDLWID